jgi:hypothetical protein
MPYEVRKNGDKWEVINKETHEVKAEHDSEEKAEKQVHLLEAIENDPEWEAKNE